MERMGPEASLMMAASVRRSELAQFAQLEYSRAERRRIEASTIEAGDQSATARSGRLLDRFQQLFRRGRSQNTRAPAAEIGASMAVAGGRVRYVPPLAVGLTGLPAAESARVSGGVATPLSALPVVGRG
jgi:hypothetical protein